MKAYLYLFGAGIQATTFHFPNGYFLLYAITSILHITLMGIIVVHCHGIQAERYGEMSPFGAL